MAKNPPGIPTIAELKAERLAHNCIHKQNKSFSNRLRNYPFDKASQIRLVSFPQSEKGKGDMNIGLPIENDTICYSKLSEIINLTLQQIDTLTDILFNVGFSGTTFLIDEITCYEPRNAIIFVDKNGKKFEYIEICFGCERTTMSSEKINLGDICRQKFELIRKFFRKVGILQGTNEER